MDLAIDAQLTNPARDQLSVLGTEVEDQDAIHSIKRWRSVVCRKDGGRWRQFAQRVRQPTGRFLLKGKAVAYECGWAAAQSGGPDENSNTLALLRARADPIHHRLRR